MTSRTPLATIPGSAPHQRLELSLVQRGDGTLLIELRDQHHAEGIGWFDQRTMTLEPRQFKLMQAALGLKAMAFEIALDTPPATIPFPGPSDMRARRTAVGEV